MEMPHLGTHCSESTCGQLDFLPMRCDACSEVFCTNHIRYLDHKCKSSYKKDIQVPVCPLCNKPVPVPRGESPDIKVGEHIDRDCQSDPAKKKRKAYSNKCTVPKCKQKELVPLLCEKCRLNHCLRHRHPTDHNCKGFPQNDIRSYLGSSRSLPKKSNSNQQQNNPTTSRRPQQTALHSVGRQLDQERRQRQIMASRSVQGGLSEDEALAKALQESLTSEVNLPKKELTQEEKDLMLAQQLQQEEEQRRNNRRSQNQPRQNNGTDSSCIVT